MKGIRFYGLIDKVKDKIMLACIFGISFKTELACNQLDDYYARAF